MVYERGCKVADITQNSYAKINLTLDVLEKRPDAYHEVRTIMQEVKLHDTIRITTVGAPGTIAITSNLPYLPCDGRNLAFKAATLFFAETGIKNPGITIELQKRIPVSAGLAGGSGNAAAVLEGLNTLFCANRSLVELQKLGERLGADVPFCLLGGTAFAEGIGEKLTVLRSLPHAFVVLSKPPVSVSTASVYTELDSRKIQSRPDTAGALNAITEGSILELARRMYNVFADVVEKKHRAILDIRDELIANGALGAVMSGSGPTTFGLFTNREHASAAYDALKNKYSDTFLTETMNE